jgi:pyrroline-5-carboxylate reductase
MISKKIGIIGCGNMGEALFSRLSASMEKSTSLMVAEMDAARRDYLQSKYKIIVEVDNSYVVKYSDIVVISVKPKDFDLLMKELCCSFSKDKLLISIAAGVTTKYIEAAVGKDVPVIRVMPNMPAVIGKSISVMARGSSVSDENAGMAKEVLSVIGDVVETDEKHLDTVTALSGSGPAYFFYMIEALAEAGIGLGLSERLSWELAVKTAIGSSRLLETSNETPQALRAKVTSKGGTTEAALKVFESKNLKDIITRAVKEAAKRSKALSKG